MKKGMSTALKAVIVLAIGVMVVVVLSAVFSSGATDLEAFGLNKIQLNFTFIGVGS